MKSKYSAVLVLFSLTLLLAAGCSDDNNIYFDKVAGISVDGITGNQIDLIEHDVYEVKVKITPETAMDEPQYRAFKYTSSNTDVFTVSSEGVITALVPGEGILTIASKVNNTVKMACVVKVSKRIYPVTALETIDFESARFIVGAKFNLNDYITVLPENASNPVLTMESLDEETAYFEKGILYLVDEGTVDISVGTTDGSGISKTVRLTIMPEDTEVDFTSLDRSEWIITATHDGLADGTIRGDDPYYLIDGNTSTGFSLYKRGKGWVGEDDEIGFTVELPEAAPINAFRLTHRNFGYDRLAPFAIDLYGSNDGVNFTLLQTGIPTVFTVGGQTVYTRMFSVAMNEYKFIKVRYSDYVTANGDTVQVMEFELGTGVFL